MCFPADAPAARQCPKSAQEWRQWRARMIIVTETDFRCSLIVADARV